MKLGATVALHIDRLSLGGDGVARIGNLVVFVPHAAPGDRLEVQITEVHQRFAKGRLLRVLDPSADRVPAPCVYVPRCGGCSWQHLSYPAQLAAKTELVRETLERLGGLKGVNVSPALGMEEPWRYRNKVQQPVGWDPQSRRLISGFYATGTHAIIPIDDCLIQTELSVRIMNRVRSLLQQFGLRAYDAQRRTGWIRHVLVRTAQDRALLVFVTRTPEFPQESKIIPALAEAFPELVGVQQNVNPASTNVILGRQWRLLAGSAFLEEKLGPLRFRLSAASFFQVNSVQAEVLYNVVRHVAGKGDRLLDLYTGIGTIALWLADNFNEVGGIEEVPQAIADADFNAEQNGIENARFEATPVEPFLQQLPRDAGGPGLTVVLDPPRAGCTRPTLDALARLNPGRIVYVSCDPGTLARDIAVLAEKGFGVEAVQPVDLFPQTPHIETVVLLRR